MNGRSQLFRRVALGSSLAESVSAKHFDRIDSEAARLQNLNFMRQASAAYMRLFSRRCRWRLSKMTTITGMPRLEIRHAYVPVTWQCVECGRDFHPRARNAVRCDHCAAIKLKTEEAKSRAELQLRRIRRRQWRKRTMMNARIAAGNAFLVFGPFGVYAFFSSADARDVSLALIIWSLLNWWNWRPHNRFRRGFDRMFPKRKHGR